MSGGSPVSPATQEPEGAEVLDRALVLWVSGGSPLSPATQEPAGAGVLERALVSS